jgi:predicted acylesterase/phospholipase RssA
MYVVVRGRIRITRGGEAVAEIGRDEPLGELGLLAGQPRSGTARAIRDTELARLDHPTFERLLTEEPSTLGWLTRRVAARVAPSGRHHRGPATRSLVVLAAVTPDRRDHFVERLAAALGRNGPCVVVAAPPPDLTAAVDAYEESGATVVLVPDGSWTEAALGQADRVMVLVDASDRPSLGAGLDVLAHLDPRGDGVAEELVLLQPGGRSLPTGTGPWLDLRPFVAHHHVREGLPTEDVERVARHVAARSIGLVLGGGGAKALAEIGVFRALREHGLPIDRVGGSSIGAVIAAQIGAGWSPAEMAEVNTREFQHLRLDRRITVPTISVLSARAAAAMFDRMFGESRLEDLWIPTFVTTVDLSRGRLSVRSRGRVATWVRASASPPAIWPAVADTDGSLHVDGAVLDNLPVAAMRDLGAASVIAVDVSVPDEFRVGPDAPEVASAFTPWRRAHRGTPRYPSLLRVLNRTAQVTSLGAREAARDDADVVIAPLLTDVGLTEYSTAERVIAAGYAEARAELGSVAAELADWS